MQTLISILFWLGIVVLIDGSLGLLYEQKWQKMVAKWNIRKIAFIEIGVAWGVLAAHFLLRYGVGGS